MRRNEDEGEGEGELRGEDKATENVRVSRRVIVWMRVKLKLE